MSSLDKYAGLGFGGDSFDFDDIQWFRGRAFPDLSLPLCSENRLSFLRHKYQIPVNAVLAGCFVRTEKLNNSDYWILITKLLEAFPDLHFVIASQAIPEIAVDYMSRPIFQRRFHHLGWVNTKEWCQCLDLYIDSFPRGSCLTALEAIKANVPVIMFEGFVRFCCLTRNQKRQVFSFDSSKINCSRPAAAQTSRPRGRRAASSSPAPRAARPTSKSIRPRCPPTASPGGRTAACRFP